MAALPFFLRAQGEFMIEVMLNSVDDAFDYFGRDNLVGISSQRQARYYVTHGAQPVFVYPNEHDERIMTYWFKKSDETRRLKREWDATKPTR